jgi:hypothetical protein
MTSKSKTSVDSSLWKSSKKKFLELLSLWKSSEDYIRSQMLGVTPVLITDNETKEETGVVRYEEGDNQRLFVTTDFFLFNEIYDFDFHLEITIVEYGNGYKLGDKSLYIHYSGGYYTPCNYSVIVDDRLPLSDITIYTTSKAFYMNNISNCTFNLYSYELSDERSFKRLYRLYSKNKYVSIARLILNTDALEYYDKYYSLISNINISDTILHLNFFDLENEKFMLGLSRSPFNMTLMYIYYDEEDFTTILEYVERAYRNKKLGLILNFYSYSLLLDKDIGVVGLDVYTRKRIEI